MKFEKTEVFNFEGALRGMRNPKNSWNLSDSFYNLPSDPRSSDKYPFGIYVIGPNDMALAQKLIKAGSVHRKFMRQIFASVDITAPLYWWKEFDTYKVGTVSNSCSTMHKLASTPITRESFEMDDIYWLLNPEDNFDLCKIWDDDIKNLEYLRQKYNETKDIRYWKELIRKLPDSYLQKRTITMNYENLYAMCSKDQRRNHKLTEWRISFINWVKTLPYTKELIFLDEIKKEEKINEESKKETEIKKEEFHPKTLADADRYMFGC